MALRTAGARLGLLVAVLVAVPTLAATAPAQRLVAALGLTSEDHGLTSVALDQHDALWAIAQPSGELAFSFTTSNAADRALGYAWTLVLAPEGAPAAERGRGSFTLRSGDSFQQKVRTRIADCSRRTEVRVEVRPTGAGATARTPRLTFWVEPALTPVAVRGGRPTCGVVK